jgi:multiple sugar transport system ATP-binding protein
MADRRNMSMRAQNPEIETDAAEIELMNVSKRFGRTTVIEDLCVSVRRNELMVFLGPSGCGKTTLLRMIAGLESVDDGEIWIGGRRADQLSPGERRVAIVFQHYALYPYMSARENMSFGLRNIRVPPAEIARRVAEAAKMLDIERLLDWTPGKMSGGEQQRVAIGRAIVKQPRVFLLDEPLSSLDAALRMRTRVELADLHRRVGAAMIFVTHDQVEAMTLAHRIAVMNQRRVEQIGTPMDIYARPATPFVAGFVGASPMNFAPAQVASSTHGFATVQLTDGTLVVTAIRTSTLPRNTRFRFGIRAEALRIGAPEPGEMRGAVRFVQRLGDRTLVHVELENGLTLIATATGASNVCVGDNVGLRIDGSEAHLFDDSRGYHAERIPGGNGNPQY